MATTLLNKKVGTNTSLLTTELNSLTSGTDSSAGTAFDNTPSTTDKGFLGGELELVVTFGTNPTASTAAYVYMIAQPDGTNYGDANSTAARLVAVFPLRATTSAQRLSRYISADSLPCCNVKFFLRTDAGQTTASSGNTLKFLPEYMQAN